MPINETVYDEYSRSTVSLSDRAKDISIWMAWSSHASAPNSEGCAQNAASSNSNQSVKTIGTLLFTTAFAAAITLRGFAASGPLPPSHLTSDLLERTDLVFSNCYPSSFSLSDYLRDPAHLQAPAINSPAPMFGWVVNDARNNVLQTAYQIQVASRLENLQNGRADVWDSGEVISDESVAVKFGGAPLQAGSVYFWQARTWNNGDPSSYSAPKAFVTGTNLLPHGTSRYPLQKTDEAPKSVIPVSQQINFLDFGRAAFGRLRLTVDSPADTTLTIRLGEVAAGNRVNQNPGGSRRFKELALPVETGLKTYVVTIPPDKRNTGKAAVKVPAYAGEVMPFRYGEIEQGEVAVATSSIVRESLHYPFADDASAFHSSSQVLNDIWELCKYSMKATSFAGVYVDGDRERIPYEADALINQKSHYAVDREYSLARFSHEYLITHPTWPTEWLLQSVMLAWNDYLFTGNLESARRCYADLKAKTLLALGDESGLISTRTGKQNKALFAALHFHGPELRDIVDWPQSGSAGVGKEQAGETDGFVFTNINTVVNAYHFHALQLMSQLAGALGEPNDAELFSRRAQQVKASFNGNLFAARRGIYVDGIGTDHASLHANMFALAFGLVPEDRQPAVVKFIESRGMACSVYGAQPLLDALYQAGAADYALDLLTTNSLRGWAHMIYAVGTTITLEAWDDQFKTNEDWNHAWGAAPANLIPFQLMGVQPVEPGWKKFQIKPQPAALSQASLTLPTIRGPIQVAFTNQPGVRFDLSLAVPANSRADVFLPATDADPHPQISLDGMHIETAKANSFVRLPEIGSGSHQVSVRYPASATAKKTQLPWLGATHSTDSPMPQAR